MGRVPVVGGARGAKAGNIPSLSYVPSINSSSTLHDVFQYIHSLILAEQLEDAAGPVGTGGDQKSQKEEKGQGQGQGQGCHKEEEMTHEPVVFARTGLFGFDERMRSNQANFCIRVSRWVSMGRWCCGSQQ